MNKAGVWAFALGLSSGVAYGQQGGTAEMPRVVLTLPRDVAPEKVMIRYMLRGEFGGYSTFVQTTAKEWNYEIAAGVDGKAATEIKIVAYMPGCEFETFDEKLAQGEIAEALECRPVRMTPLRGQIAADGISEQGSRSVQVVYVAPWVNRFFGIYDGMLMMIPLGDVKVDPLGAFEIMVPSYTGMAGEGSAALEFFFSQGKISGKPGALDVIAESAVGNSLTVSSDYPEVVQLVAVTQ